MYDQDVKDLETRLAAIREELAPLEARRAELWEQLKKAREDRDKAVDPASLTIGDHLAYDHQETDIAHRRAKEFFRQLGLPTAGYYPITMQRRLEICAYKGRPGEVERLSVAIHKVKPHIIPCNGRIAFDIFEQTLSKGGVYELSFDSHNWSIIKTIYGSEKNIKTNLSLQQALEYVVDRLYYEDVNSSEED